MCCLWGAWNGVCVCVRTVCVQQLGEHFGDSCRSIMHLKGDQPSLLCVFLPPCPAAQVTELAESYAEAA